MSVAKVTEISASSPESFEDAVRQGIERAGATLQNIQSVWIKEQTVKVANNKPSEWRVNMKVTFVLND